MTCKLIILCYHIYWKWLRMGFSFQNLCFLIKYHKNLHDFTCSVSFDINITNIRPCFPDVSFIWSHNLVKLPLASDSIYLENIWSFKILFINSLLINETFWNSFKVLHLMYLASLSSLKENFVQGVFYRLYPLLYTLVSHESLNHYNIFFMVKTSNS